MKDKPYYLLQSLQTLLKTPSICLKIFPEISRNKWVSDILFVMKFDWLAFIQGQFGQDILLY